MKYVICFLLGAWILVILSSFFCEYTAPYKQGQIDALSGKVLFELQPQPDGSTKWERKP